MRFELADRALFSQRQEQVILLTLAAAALLFVGVLAAGVGILVVRPPVPDAPIVYSATRYEPSQPVLCAGEWLAFRVSYTIAAPATWQDGEPIIFETTRFYWDDTEQRKARTVAGIPTASIIEAGGVAAPGDYSTERRFLLPDLPPGSYRLLTSVRSPTSTARGYSVPFQVAACGAE